MAGSGCPRSAVSLATILVALMAAPASAQSVLKAGPEFQVNSYTIGPQQRPSVAMSASGTTLVVWESEFQDGDSLGVYGRFFDRAGAPLGLEFRLNQATAGAQTRPSATAGAGGRFTVVWAGLDGSGSGIFARQFTTAGPLGPEFQVNTYTTGEQVLPRVSAGPGGLAVAWQSNGQDGSGAGVYGRLFTPAGAPVSDELLLSESVNGDQTTPVVAALDNGRYAVAWLRPDSFSPTVYSRLFDAAGVPLRPETQVAAGQWTRRDHVSIAASAFGTYAVAWWEASIWTGKDGFFSWDLGIQLRNHDPNGEPTSVAGTGGAGMGTVARWQGAQGMTYLGRALVAYASTPGALTCFAIPPDPLYCQNVFPEDGSGAGVFAKPLGWSGAPARIQVNTFTPGHQNLPSVGADGRGNVLVAWQSMAQDGSDAGIFAQRLGGLFPGAAAVDAAGNGVLDPGQPQEFRPSWLNLNGAAQPLFGSLYGYGGPPGGTYSIVDGTGIYGTVPNGSTGACTDCYTLDVAFDSGRPALHVDSFAGESLSADIHTPWALHVGGSFTDVSAASPFYRFVETLLHASVTSGCGGTSYCPGAATGRDQMAAFVLVARHGAGYVPPACTTPMFLDVPASSPFCAWIEELARRGVAGGCGGGNYCPASPVTREQMAVFVLRTLDPALDPPACTTPLFADVPASSPFCRWIEELARRGVVGGCGGGNYCPASEVTREQMAVFLAATFGLRLY